ncbi:MAG: serine/threonine-protein kinase [Anaerolineae bacterium]
MATTLVGRKLGLYDITALLGQGGMATVYKGYREDIDRYVAVKVLPPHPGLDQQFVDRFKLEARTIARLQHPHILPLYDYGVEDEILYLVMAYIEGGSLSNRIDKGKMPLNEIDRILRQVATALDYAHRQGIIHRDIKPDNILLDKEGNPLLADFGIVKIAGGDDTRPALTLTGGLVGTPAYMAPEQGSGESKITNAADIYSLGVVVYEMLTGKKPYTADTPMQVVVKHITEPVPNPLDVDAELPAAFETIIQRALAKKPENRYQTAMELADDISRAVQGTAAFANPVANVQPSPNPTIKTPVVVEVPTTPPNTPVPTTSSETPTPAPTQTIIVQQGTNPLLLLGGFGAIAALLVVLVFALNNRPINEVADAPTATLQNSISTARPTNVAAAANQAPQFGTVNFSAGKVAGDTVTLQVENLKPPASDEEYVAWLKNTSDGSMLMIGELTLNPLGSGVMTPYVDIGGRVLPTLFNAIALTREKKGQIGSEPAGEVAYSGSVPIEVTKTLYDLYVTSPDGIALSAINSTDYVAPAGAGETAGLLASMMAEALRGQQHAGLAQLQTVGGSIGAMHTHNEHTINIMNGTLIDYDGVNGGQNPGFQKGVVLYLDKIQEQLNNAAKAPGSTASLQANAELARICLDNTRKWMNEVIAFEQTMLQANDTASMVDAGKQSALLAINMVKGADANGNGQIEPYEDECGLTQVETFGLLISTIALGEGELSK